MVVAREARTTRGASTRERLLDAARQELTANQGEVELAAVAKRAGVSPGLPYRYFDSKSALVVAVVESFFDTLDDVAYRPVFDEFSDDWWVREQFRIERLVGFFYEEPLGPFVIAHLAGDAQVVTVQQQRIVRQIRGASRNIRTGKELGRVPDHIDHTLERRFTWIALLSLVLTPSARRAAFGFRRLRIPDTRPPHATTRRADSGATTARSK